MKTLTKVLLAVSLLVFSPNVRGAPISDGTYQATFSSVNGDLLLFDLSGSYQHELSPEFRAELDQAIADALDYMGLENVEVSVIESLLGKVSLNYTLHMDSKGKFTGQGTLTAGVVRPDVITGSIVFNIGVTLNGSIKTSGKVTRLKTNMKLTGDVTLALSYSIVSVEGKATVAAPLKMQLVVNGSSGRVSGKVTGRIAGALPDFKKKKTWPVKGNVAFNMPKVMTGGWNLLVNVTHLNRNYFGDGAITLYNGLRIPMSITGKYSEKKDVSTLTLKGLEAFTGAKVDIKELKASGTPQDSAFLYNADYLGTLMGQSFKTRPVAPQ